MLLPDKRILIERQTMHHGIQRRALCALATASMLVGLSQSAIAKDQQQLYTRSLAATCANCHGTDGKAVSGSAVVPLAGLTKEHIATQMKAFKSGTRPATVMHQISKGYSDAQIEQIAAYFAAQK
jgi:cytochrome subunit of sulfide dehydrogenase